jgi:DNA-binding PadR family transcriptional regulator
MLSSYETSILRSCAGDGSIILTDGAALWGAIETLKARCLIASDGSQDGSGYTATEAGREYLAKFKEQS